MGTFYSYFDSNSDNDTSLDNLPTPIKEYDLEKSKNESISQFRDNLRNLGFVVIEMNDDFNKNALEYRNLCKQWFYENSFDDKYQYASKYDSELSKQIGHKPNVGYILTENIKEYIRYKTKTNNELFPNKNFQNIFNKLFKRWNKFTNQCIDIIFDEKVKVFDNKTQTINSECLLSENEKNELIERNAKYSSISCIHYFGNGDNDDLKENQNINQRDNEIALEKHQDTGVLTFILCSDVAGLKILDRKSNKYVKVENIYDHNKCLFIIAGRKMEHVFSWKHKIEATWHSVNIPVNTERFSLLYFLEIQKDW